MKYAIVRNSVCTDPVECFNTMLAKLESGTACVLHADKTVKEVHGSLSCLHEKNNHIWTVEFYEKNEEPNSEHSEVTLTKLHTIPNESQIKDLI